MSIVFINNEPLNAKNASVLYESTAFQWGMSVFTTGRISKQKVTFASAHIKRLITGVAWLFNDSVEEGIIIENLKNGFKESGLSGDEVKFRYTLSFNKSFSKICHILELEDFKGHDQSQSLCSYEVSQLPFGFSDQVKIGNYAQSFYTKRKLGEEVFFFDKEGKYLEASVANIILREKKSGRWVYPEGEYLKGIGLVNGLKGLGLESRKVLCHEKEQYDRLAMINALRGIQPIHKWDERKLSTSEEDFFELKKGFQKNSLEDYLSL